MQPIELFYRDGKLPTRSAHRNKCTLEHGLTPATNPKRRTQKKKNKVRKKDVRDSLTVGMYWVRENRNRQTTAGAVFRPQRMTRTEYAQYLRSEHWQKFAANYRATVDGGCYVCDDPSYELHHHTYSTVGHETFSDVIPLCSVHHRATHNAVQNGKSLRDAHVYIRSRYLRDELDVKTKRLDAP